MFLVRIYLYWCSYTMKICLNRKGKMQCTDLKYTSASINCNHTRNHTSITISINQQQKLYSQQTKLGVNGALQRSLGSKIPMGSHVWNSFSLRNLPRDLLVFSLVQRFQFLLWHMFHWPLAHVTLTV